MIEMNISIVFNFVRRSNSMSASSEFVENANYMHLFVQLLDDENASDQLDFHSKAFDLLFSMLRSPYTFLLWIFNLFPFSSTSHQICSKLLVLK